MESIGRKCTPVGYCARPAEGAGTSYRPEVTECRAVRHEVVMIEVHEMVVPVGTPVMPTPAVASKYPDPDSNSEEDARSVVEESGDIHPARIECEGSAIDKPRIVFRHVDDLWIDGLDRNRLILCGHIFLGCTLQVAGLLRGAAHVLNGVHNRGLVVAVRISE